MAVSCLVGRLDWAGQCRQGRVKDWPREVLSAEPAVVSTPTCESGVVCLGLSSLHVSESGGDRRRKQEQKIQQPSGGEPDPGGREPGPGNGSNVEETVKKKLH
jgi:hypothetical protein